MERESEIIKYYNLGYSYQSIGEFIGVSKKTVNRRVDELKEKGILKDRAIPSGHTRKPKKVISYRHANNLETIRALYEADIPLKEICMVTGFKYGTITRIITELYRSGMPKRERKREREYVPKQKKKPTYKIGEPHRCDYKTCVYGNVVNPDTYKCNFCLITGKCRSTICPSCACTVYERVSKKNPRRRGADEP